MFRLWDPTSKLEDLILRCRHGIYLPSQALQILIVGPIIDTCSLLDTTASSSKLHAQVNKQSLLMFSDCLMGAAKVLKSVLSIIYPKPRFKLKS